MGRLGQQVQQVDLRHNLGGRRHDITLAYNGLYRALQNDIELKRIRESGNVKACFKPAKMPSHRDYLIFCSYVQCDT